MSPEIPNQQVVYEASREYLLNNLAQLQRLQEEGIHVGTLPEKTWDDIVELIENQDEEELKRVREELKAIEHSDLVQKMWDEREENAGTRQDNNQQSR